MNAVTPVRRAARRTEHNEAFTTAARLGFIGYGLTHALIGWLAVQVAWGHASDESDQSGAFRLIAQQPLEPGEDDTLVDELLESNPAFQALVAESKVSPRKPFSSGGRS